MQQVHGTVSPQPLIDVAAGIDGPIRRKLYSLIGSPFERLLAVSALNRLYADFRAEAHETAQRHGFFEAALRFLSIELEVSDADRARIPASGPVVLVSNHPFGGIEGLVLGALLQSIRPDTKLLGHAWLGELPGLGDGVIGVDVEEEDAAANVTAVRRAIRHVQGAGALVTFPAGAVSHLHLRQKQVVDPPWRDTAALIARRTGATVVPVYFEGRNGSLFQLAGLIHPRLRTALLPHELLRKSRSTVRLRIGKPLGAERLARFATTRLTTDYLRFKTYALAQRDEAVRPRFRNRPSVESVQAPIIDAVPPALLAAEIARLPAEALLVDQGPLQVFVARMAQIPATMREIGRLREIAFREVGEGTGRSLDLDAFDASYVHLFLWNKDKQELAGGYRLGLADRILEQSGVRGLYTSTLFKFREGFLDRLNPAIELGRSFVRPEYQRRPLSLALLWRGIGELVVRNPQYKVLFGPVSISNKYEGLSRRLMIEYLTRARGDEELAAMVTSRNPPKQRLRAEDRAVLETLAVDEESLSGLIADLEDDDKGLPVLLKHYLKLNARLLGFNVDPAFGDCTDGLIVVDLRTTEPKVLKRFMGEAGYAFFASVSPAATS
jgi:putative hemolysin